MRGPELEALFAVVARWLCWPDWEALKVVLAVALSSRQGGDPVWLILIKDSGGGGTEILRALEGWGKDRVFLLGALTAHTLISGLKIPPQEADLAPKLNDKLVVLYDAGALQSLPHDDKALIFEQLRRAYDGYLAHAYGSGVEPKSYPTRFGFIAAATPSIDRERVLNAQLGERFLKSRLMVDRAGAVAQARANTGQEDTMRGELRETLGAFLRAREGLEFPPLADPRLEALADWATWARSEVPRDRRRNILGAPNVELGTRMVKQLEKLGRALRVVEEGDPYPTLIRVATDCLPPFRWKVLQGFHVGAATGHELARAVNLPRRTVTEELEDLQVLGIVEEIGTAYRLTPRFHERMQQSDLEVPPSWASNSPPIHTDIETYTENCVFIGGGKACPRRPGARGGAGGMVSSVQELIAQARCYGRLELADGKVIVEGRFPGLLLEELRAHKVEVRQAILGEAAGWEADPLGRGPHDAPKGPLAEYAAHLPSVPVTRFTLRETEDVEDDAEWLRRIRRVIQEHQPGGNRIILNIVTLDGRRVGVEWRAVASRTLRQGIASLLRRKAQAARDSSIQFNSL